MPAIVPRRSAERGSADHGWLKSKFTFSFAEYNDPRFDSYGPLRVLNDDTVAAAGGFPTHGHRDFEIFSYILSGALEHKDSMGNSEVLGRGHIQFTTAGTGISHSEFNADKTRGGAPVRFLQIWVVPNARGLKPAYQTGFFSDAEKTDTLRRVIEPASTPAGARTPGALTINNDVTMHAAVLGAGARVTLRAREGYVHVPIMPGAAGVELLPPPGQGDAVRLAPGDGAFLSGLDGELTIVGLAAQGVGAAGDGAVASAKTEFVVLTW